MKTLKQVMMLIIAGGLFTSVNAQEKKKVCIKMVNNDNGVETKIDTCFNNHDDAEAYIKNNNIQVAFGGNKIVLPSGSTDGKNANISTFEWHGVDSAVTMDKDIKVIVDDKGNVIVNTNDGSEPHVINISGVTDTLINEVNVHESVASDGKKQVVKTVKIIVIRKIDVSDVSENDKKNLTGIISQSKNKFSDLKVWSGEGKLNIGFASQSNDPITVNVFDVNGKSVRVEKEAGLLGNYNKVIYLADMPMGIYFVQIQQGNKSETKKVVISESNQ